MDDNISEQNRTFSYRLAACMARMNMKASDLSKKTGIDKGAISNYLKGKYIPKQDNLYQLSRVLCVSPAWLSGIDKIINPVDFQDEDSFILSQYHNLNSDGKAYIKQQLAIAQQIYRKSDFISDMEEMTS